MIFANDGKDSSSEISEDKERQYALLFQCHSDPEASGEESQPPSTILVNEE